MGYKEISLKPISLIEVSYGFNKKTGVSPAKLELVMWQVSFATRFFQLMMFGIFKTVLLLIIHNIVCNPNPKKVNTPLQNIEF